MVYYLILTVYVLVCLVLIGVILLQQGKGGDMASAFGGGGGSQAVFGARSGATLLTRATSVLAALFVVLSLVITAWGLRGPGSVVGGIGAPAPAPVTVPTPTTDTPAAAPAAPTSPPPGGGTQPPQ
ncbi:MAG TPA: preprotein translocase subunit SecG [Vicinamibacterales bacterium]|nr:preprotein translocase subunit SecG [Vicinamibacterales bacterium]